MENLKYKTFEESDESPESKGREAIPVDAALSAQIKLIKHMTPKELQGYLSDTEEDPVLEALTMRWLEKYTLKFNGFAEYCNLHGEDNDFMERITQMNLTKEDFNSMQTFLEESTEGGVLFTDEELADFIKEKVPRNS